MSIFELSSWLLAILGLTTSIFALYFAYVTYISPMVRFKWYLRNNKKWRVISTRMDGWSEFLQYQNHPEFTIREVHDRKWERDEPWMSKVIKPDSNRIAYQVHLSVNGNIIQTEGFLSMDGHRIYVPIPRVEFAQTGEEKDNIYYYDRTQKALAQVIGKFHGYQNIKHFSEMNGIRLSYKPEKNKRDI